MYKHQLTIFKASIDISGDVILEFFVLIMDPFEVEFNLCLN
jgi:hypothetical protein